MHPREMLFFFFLGFNTSVPSLHIKLWYRSPLPPYPFRVTLYLLGPDAWRSSASGSPLHACSSRCLGGTVPGSAAASDGGPGPRNRLLARCTPRTGWWESKRTPRHNWTVSRRAADKRMRHGQNKHKTPPNAQHLQLHVTVACGLQQWMSKTVSWWFRWRWQQIEYCMRFTTL